MKDKILEANIKRVFKDCAIEFARTKTDSKVKARTIHELAVFIAQSDFAESLAVIILNGEIKSEKPVDIVQD